MSAPVLVARELTRVFPGRRGRPAVRAVDGVSLEVREGEIVALVGESGCGKSTLARLLVGLEAPDAGALTVAGAQTPDDARRAVQIVFQDPYLSLNPRMSVGATIAEPLAIRPDRTLPRRARGAARRERVLELLAAVGLPAETAALRPFQLSGGGRQRVAIARALALRPRLVVLDEPISALDPSVGAQVMALLTDLSRREGLALLLISHDLATVRGVAGRVAVMDAGRIVEEGPAARVLSAPTSARGRALVEAAQLLSPPPWVWAGSTVQA